MLLKTEDMLDFGAAPAVDRLVVVANDADRAMGPYERLNQAELHAVRVLVFIDLHMIEAGLMSFQNFGELVKQRVREQQQIVKVHGAAGAEIPLVALVRAR